MTSGRIYLDHNASAPLRAAARAAMIDVLDRTGNASSVHAEGRELRKIVESARDSVAALCGAQAEHVVFTSGATEAANFLLTPDWRMGRAPLRMSRLYVGATEHPAVLKGGRFTPEAITVLPVGTDGSVNLDALASALAGHDRTIGLPLVAVQMANSETGVLQPISEIASIVHDAGGVLIVDAVQAAGRVALDISRGSGDFLILSSHKIGGPQGAGAVVGRADLMMPAPLLTGGGHERGHRAGTENAAAIAGFGAAAAAARDLSDLDRQRRLRDAAEAAVVALCSDATVYGAQAPRLPNTLCFALPGTRADTMQIAFDLAGISVSAGSACSSGRIGPSVVLAAMGYPENQGGVRLSVGPSTSEEDIARFRAVMADFVSRRRASPKAA